MNKKDVSEFMKATDSIIMKYTDEGIIHLASNLEPTREIEFWRDMCYLQKIFVQFAYLFVSDKEFKATFEETVKKVERIYDKIN